MSSQTAIRQALAREAVESRISCSRVHAVAGQLGFPPGQVMKMVDELALKLIHCQLALFDRSPLATEEIPPQVATRILEASPGKTMACSEVWKLALELDLPRETLGKMATALGVKIIACQLGCF